ncbi:MAG: DUF1761 domain-containing protein [Bacteroidota bacterium]
MNPLLAQALAAIVPMIIGFLWYNPKTFEPAWMKTIGMTKEKQASGNMAVIFGVSLLMAFILTQPLTYFVNHPSQFGGDPSGDTFGHGAFHGIFTSILIALPIISTKALFEQRSIKYVLINWGYWAVTLALMGGILDAALPTVGS